MRPANLNPTSTDPYSHHLHATQHFSYYSHNPKPSEPNCSSAGIDPALKPPGADPYLSLTPYAHGHGGYVAHHPSGVAYAHYQTVDAGSVAVPPSSYLDPNSGILVQNWGMNEVVQQYGANLYVTGGTVPQHGTQQLVSATPNPTTWTNPAIQPRGPWKKGPKKTKIVQSAWCEFCKVECNSKDVLDQHKLGKKHMKNVGKLKAATAPAPSPVVSAVLNNLAIGPQENPAKGNSVSGQKKKKAAETADDLETKRRKIMEGGAAANAVRSCAICNVVCNSETVFQFHLAGQKHISMMKKHAYGTGLATAI